MDGIIGCPSKIYTEDAEWSMEKLPTAMDDQEESSLSEANPSKFNMMMNESFHG